MTGTGFFPTGRRWSEADWVTGEDEGGGREGQISS